MSRLPLEEARRRLAGIGANARVRTAGPPRARPRSAPGPPAVGTAVAVPPIAGRPRRAAPPVPGAARRMAVPSATARIHGVSAGLASRVDRVAPVAAAARGVSPPAPAAARRPAAGTPPALLRQRRERIPWPRLPRPRLAAAWERLLREHGVPAHDLRLVAVVGPLPLGAVRAAGLDADGRVVVALAPGPAPGPSGDLALARPAAGGRLLRSAVPYPAAPAGRRARRR